MIPDTSEQLVVPPSSDDCTEFRRLLLWFAEGEGNALLTWNIPYLKLWLYLLSTRSVSSHHSEPLTVHNPSKLSTLPEHFLLPTTSPSTEPNSVTTFICITQNVLIILRAVITQRIRYLKDGEDIPIHVKYLQRTGKHYCTK